MPAKPMIGLLLAATAALPVLAQSTDGTGRTPQEEYGTGRTPQEEYRRGYATTPMPNQAAINAAGAPVTAAINNQVAATAQANGDAASADAASTQAQYDADRAAYLDALVRHDAAVDRTDARYARQQIAYADAMRAWRRQVYACKHGHPRACDMPPPNPATFY